MVEVKKSDVEFLKGEYQADVREYTMGALRKDKHESVMFYIKGHLKGLEIALRRLGVSKYELDDVWEDIEKEVLEVSE